MSEKVKRIESGTSLREYLTNVFEVGMKSALAQRALTEKEKQGQAVSSQQPPEDSSGDGVDDLFGGEGGDEEPQPSKTMDDETEKLKDGEISPRDVVELLNAIRGGKSLKDAKISQALEEYINSLSRPEKVALMAFLKGISQIVSGQIAGGEAQEPSDNPSDVQMQKGDEKSVKHVQPNVIKGGGKPGPSGATKSAEDTSAPAPITPKRR